MSKLINIKNLKTYTTELIKKIREHSVTGVNSIKGDVTITGKDGIVVDTKGQEIMISADIVGGVASVNGIEGAVRLTKEGKLDISTEGDNIKISTSEIELDIQANAKSILEVDKKVQLLNTAESHYIVNTYEDMLALESRTEEEDGDSLKHAEIIHVLQGEDEKGTYIYNAEGESEQEKFIKIADLETVSGVGEHTHIIDDIEGLREALNQAGKSYELRIADEGLQLVDSEGIVASTVEFMTQEEIIELIQSIFEA